MRMKETPHRCGAQQNLTAHKTLISLQRAALRLPATMCEEGDAAPIGIRLTVPQHEMILLCLLDMLCGENDAARVGMDAVRQHVGKDLFWLAVTEQTSLL